VKAVVQARIDEPDLGVQSRHLVDWIKDEPIGLGWTSNDAQF
jgi:hypothetical protein